jgi:hypothetical protein
LPEPSHQALIQRVRDFCDHSNAICEHCKLPELAGKMTAMVVSVQEVAEKTGHECKMSQFQDRLRHIQTGRAVIGGQAGAKMN